MDKLKCKIPGISIRSLILVLFLFTVFLLGMNFFPERVSTIIDSRFSLDEEANVPTWYSTILLYSISIASFVLYFFSFKEICRNNIWRFYWLVFGSVYLFLSLDEASQIHEILDEAQIIKWIYLYMFAGGTFFLVTVIYFLTIRNDIKNIRNLILSGLVIYALGGMGMELISDVFSPLPQVLQQIEFILEEGLEMIGSIMVLTGCIMELNRLYKVKHTEFKDSLIG